MNSKNMSASEFVDILVAMDRAARLLTFLNEDLMVHGKEPVAGKVHCVAGKLDLRLTSETRGATSVALDMNSVELFFRGALYGSMEKNQVWGEVSSENVATYMKIKLDLHESLSHALTLMVQHQEQNVLNGQEN